MDYTTLTIALAGLITAISSALYQRRKSIIEKTKSRIELDILEHKLVLDVVEKYKGLADPLTVRIDQLKKDIEHLEEDIRDHLITIQEAEIEKNQLRQTIVLQSAKIDILEKSQHDLELHAVMQSKRITELEIAIKKALTGRGNG